MAWVVKICEIGGGRRRERSVLNLGDIDAPISIEQLGLSLDQGKAIMAAIQRTVISVQSVALADYAKARARSEAGVVLKDYRLRRVDTVYGRAEIRVPRLERDGVVDPSTNWPSHCRSTTEFDELRMTLSAWMSYRAAEKLMSGLLPISGGRHHTSFRNQVLGRGAAAEAEGGANPAANPAGKMNLGLDCTFIRSHARASGRLHEVLIGHIERDTGSARVFSSIGEAGVQRVGRIKHNLARAGWVDSTLVTTFTDGGGGLRQLARGSGLTEMPILDWHHVAQRLQHVRQAALGLKSNVPDLPEVTAKIAAEVERLRWRLWNGKPKAVSKTIEIILPLIRTKRKPSTRRRPVRPWNALMTSLFFLRKYTSGQEAWMTNYARRHRLGDRVGTSQTESAANSLVNKRMNKSQQMRWSILGARRLLQVRAAVINGDLAPFAPAV